MWYEYKCSDGHGHTGCGHVFIEDLEVDERMIPMNEPCPECGKSDQIIRLFGCHVHRSVINARNKMSTDYKETLDRIKKEHPDMQSSH